MGWWADFDRSEVAADFARIAAGGLDSVRLFLTWEDFQPTRHEVDQEMLDRLVTVADLAARAGLAIVPTLFTGHMSGVNWVPGWALGGSVRDDRFRVVSGGNVSGAGLRNWYADEEITRAQALLAGEAAAALAGHEALLAWDLGNENSNCVVPPSRSSARRWLQRISTAIRAADQTALVMVGLHMEDLEEDRRLGPSEATEVCDLLSMHGYPIYATWADGPTDEHLLPFLAQITRWLGKGREVMFSEFGLPTYRAGDESRERAPEQSASLLVEEEAAAAYMQRALAALRGAGCAGAMVWCYTDYDPAIWAKPPLDVAIHERSFGLWRADGSPKPAVAAVQAFTGTTRLNPPEHLAWIDIDPDKFYADPRLHLRRLYRRYRQSEGVLPARGH
ncbi:MAG TPA: cellulase family glycosylhydrolase [Gaiellaceae bacterium]